jgi:PA14 domain
VGICRAGRNEDFLLVWTRATRTRGANPWGLKNVHSGASEWCFDWYGPYLPEDQVDPIGPAGGLTRVVRGGGLDRDDSYYRRSRNRASYAPGFALMRGTEAVEQDRSRPAPTEPMRQGLIGVWYGRTNLADPKAVDEITTLDLDWKTFQQPGQDRGDMWAAQWEGNLTSPASGRVTFHAATDHGMKLIVNGESVVDWKGAEDEKSNTVQMVEGKSYPVRVVYIHDHGEKSYLVVRWSWAGQKKSPIPRDSLRYSPAQHEQMKRIAPKDYLPGHHSIGFRIVQSPMPSTEPGQVQRPFLQQCVLQRPAEPERSPDYGRPWFRRRSLLPVLPVSVSREECRMAGLHPALLPHLHNPGLAVLPNGDLLAVLFASEHGPGGEDQPEVALVATRLRHGASQWDMPEPFIDFADVNDTSSLLMVENNTLYCFWGHTFYNRAYPFQWMTSTDNGASWSQVRFPQFAGEIGPHTLPSDAIGGSSVMWASRDGMRTWHDTGGRTLGRHTNVVLLKDGRILGMGGKNAGIDDPKRQGS